MIEEATGNLLEADVDALVNTVNTVGVMGKGIALQFKRAFPENFRQYEKACKNKQVRLGEMFVHEVTSITGPRFIINFPTKGHWKARSRIEDIDSGLQDLRRVIQKYGITSIAVPPLGCGNGGLDWAQVYPMIQNALGDPSDVRVLVYPPAGALDPKDMPVRTKRPAVTRAKAALLLAFERYRDRSVQSGLSDTGAISLVEAQKVAYFLQLAGGKATWTFAPSHFGPYAATIDQFISSVEGHFIHGYGDGSSGSKATLTLEPDALDEARHVLGDDEAFQRTLERFEAIVDGFEFPYGIELLSTVHYVVAHAPAAPSLDELVTTIGQWSARKGRLFKPRQAQTAYRHLQDVRLADTTVTD
ncbi:type II toxin-antitoxin system antitoxin DNA ADP-ribosyl glycohydrolase DarG [Amycolatopsis magusensis]|uniref:type II toxin-antitoxin system antitoxin DNA ADP-ribosyl glycohydrolase DarG n=1 Tax=Amycolatopsis magusensis TaxID=882444 RepID=UPI003C2DC4FE